MILALFQRLLAPWRGSFFALAAGIFVFSSMPTRGDETSQPLAPYERMRLWQEKQEGFAQGTPVPKEELSALFSEIGEMFQQASPDRYQDRRNAYALLTYILHGGDRRLLKVFFRKDMKGVVPESLLSMMLAYVLGDRKKAQTAAQNLPIRDLPDSMAGQIALLAADILSPVDPRKALSYLAFARLAMPGTLIEETALRRGLALELQLKDRQNFVFLALRYVRRFPHSIYTPAFDALLLDAMISIEDFEVTKGEGRDVFEALPKQRRCTLLREATRRRFTAGYLELAHEFTRALGFCEDLPDLKASLIFYKTTLEVLKPEPLTAQEAPLCHHIPSFVQSTPPSVPPCATILAPLHALSLPSEEKTALRWSEGLLAAIVQQPPPFSGDASTLQGPLSKRAQAILSPEGLALVDKANTLLEPSSKDISPPSAVQGP